MPMRDKTKTKPSDTRRVPVHPGQILLHEFIEPLGMSQYRLAKSIDVPQTRIAAIIKGRRSITADTALRLGRFFDVDAKLWLNLQQSHDLASAEHDLEDLDHAVPVTAAELSNAKDARVKAGLG